MTRKRIGFLVVIVLIGLSVVGAIMSKRKKHYPTVNFTRVESANLSREVSANGEIRSKRRAVVVAKVNGTVSKVFVKEGSFVRKGDTLVILDKEKLSIKKRQALSALESARNSVKEELLNLRVAFKQAKANLEQAKRNLKSIEALYKIQSASDEQLADAKDKYEIAQDNYLSALQRLNLREGREINDSRNTPPPSDKEIIENSTEVRHAIDTLNAIEDDLRNCTIKSPIDGVVTTLKVEEGAVVGMGSPVAEVQNTRDLEVVVNIDEVDIGYVRLGQKVRIESDTFIDSTLTGKVSYIAPVIRNVGDSRVCEVDIDINDPKGLAKVGASCSIYITVEKKNNVPSIGIDQYFLEKNKKFVYKLARPGDLKKSTYENLYKLVKTEIKTGIMGVEKVEVVSGLRIGDMVLRGNLKLFHDGEVVEVKEKEKSAEKK